MNSDTKKGPLCSIWHDNFWKNKINAKLIVRLVEFLRLSDKLSFLSFVDTMKTGRHFKDNDWATFYLIFQYINWLFDY